MPRLCATGQHSSSGTCQTTIKTFQSVANSKPMMLMSCSSSVSPSGFVIKSAGFIFVPNFFVMNRPDLEAPCIHRFCTSRCRFSPHDTPSPWPRSESRAPQMQFNCGIQLALGGRQRHDLLFLGPHFEAMLTSHDDSSRHRSPSGLVTSPVSI